MSIPLAQDIIRRLRSQGIKVFLRDRGPHYPPEVHTTGLDKAPAAIRLRLVEQALFVRQVLLDEKKVREARAVLRDKRQPKERGIKDVPSDQL